MNKHWIYLRIIHILIDIALIYGSFLLAYFMRIGWIISTEFSFYSFAIISVFCSAVWIVFLLLSRYYRLPPRSGAKASYDFLIPIIGGCIAVGLLIVTYFFQRELFFSRLMNAYILIGGSVFLITSRFIFLGILSRAKSKGILSYKTLIIGANQVGQKVTQAITKDPYAPYKIIGVIDPYGLQQESPNITILGKLDQLEHICDQHKITAIIQCDAFEHTINIIALCEEKNIKFQFEPALRGIFEKNLTIREVAGMTMISYVKRDFTTKNMRIFYKIIDVIQKYIFDIS